MRVTELVEGSDGKLDEQALLSILGVLTFLGLAIFSTVTRRNFDMQGFGIGFGAVMGATLAGMGFRSSRGGS